MLRVASVEDVCQTKFYFGIAVVDSNSTTPPVALKRTAFILTLEPVNDWGITVGGRGAGED